MTRKKFLQLLGLGAVGAAIAPTLAKKVNAAPLPRIKITQWSSGIGEQAGLNDWKPLPPAEWDKACAEFNREQIAKIIEVQSRITQTCWDDFTKATYRGFLAP